MAGAGLLRLAGVGCFLAGGEVEGGEGAAFEFGALGPEIEGEERQDEQDLDGDGEGEARHAPAERRLVLRGARAVVGRIQGVGSLMSVLREKGAGPSTIGSPANGPPPRASSGRSLGH